MYLRHRLLQGPKILQCIKGFQCPPLSTRAPNRTCVCYTGLTFYDSSCAKCPFGAATYKCLYFGGLNAKFNESSKKCQCIDGFDIYKKICDKCPNDYFIKDDHYVQCPINSIFNRVSNKCDCKNGFMLGNNGFCISECKKA